MGRIKIHNDDSYKLSFIVDDKIKKILDADKDNYGSKYGPMINFILENLCNMPEKVKRSLLDFCSFQVKNIINQIDYADDFAKQDLIKEKQVYLNIAKIINHGKSINILRQINIKNGVLHIPDNWIVVNPEDAEKCQYAAVMECQNSNRYGIPHFILLCNYRYGQDYPKDFENQFIKKCCVKWPNFKEQVLDKQVVGIPSMDGKGLQNEKEFLEAPNIGIFHIWEENDEHLSSDETPYGSKIVRI
ncbi:MAG: hypothetical protein K6B14_10275 [Lachnospiraceae bacterium]|nr:hypothetical protein [Lachnospiraceae bacterium]